ncbi:alpha/beta hydrolase [Salegentibacter chungangensis]|uniref:Alpha/beta hydrolase n=1 Tax=Salegentibacter chungangensis TaxID=1335724 RepID=A0ABW3NR59_9FLAO
MKKRYWIPLVFLFVLVITYFSGPRPSVPSYSYELPDLPKDLQQLEDYVKRREASEPVRKDNQARIKWQDSVPQITEYSLVYLHGFAGSYRDGFPVNINIADSLNANLFLTRWGDHGLKPAESLENFSPEAAWNSAKEALVIGNLIGRKVIIMSTSTGGTLAIKLAAEYPELVYALINMSPNLEDDVPGAFILNSPWGYEVARLVSFGERKKVSHQKEIARQYWDTVYPSSALVDLQSLVETTMTPQTFKKVKTPVLTLYYKQNFIQKDEHVEVSFYPEVHKQFATPDSLVELTALETPGTHFIGSNIKSKDTEVVEKEILEYLKNKLKIDLSSE